jgi:hypothetical protein
MRRALFFLLVAGTSACGGSDDPGAPTAPPSPISATPVPSPSPTPNPYAAACGTPLPRFEDSYGFGTKVQLEPTRNRKVLNTNPMVRNTQYCTQVFGQNQAICNTRFEDSPQRVPCDHYMSGVSYTGRPGPNWFEDRDGRLLKCGGVGGVPEESGNCRLKPENQYLLDISAPGYYVACGGEGSPGTCGGCYVAPEYWGIIHRSPAGICRPF